MNDTVKYFERRLRKLERDMLAADRRRDEGAVAALRKKMEYHRDAVRALKGEAKTD